MSIEDTLVRIADALEVLANNKKAKTLKEYLNDNEKSPVLPGKDVVENIVKELDLAKASADKANYPVSPVELDEEVKEINHAPPPSLAIVPTAPKAPVVSAPTVDVFVVPSAPTGTHTVLDNAELNKVLQAKAKEIGSAAEIFEIIKTYNVTGASAIPPELQAEFLAKVKALK